MASWGSENDVWRKDVRQPPGLRDEPPVLKGCGAELHVWLIPDFDQWPIVGDRCACGEELYSDEVVVVEEPVRRVGAEK